MSAPYHNQEDRVEDAIKAYLAANLTSPTNALHVKTAFNFDDAEPDFISIASPRSMENPPDTGTYDVMCVVSVVTSKSTTRAAHAAHVAKVLDLMHDSNLLTYLNALASVGLIFQLVSRGPKTRQLKEDALRITSQEFEFMVVMT